ncbi:sugar ABC transporter permease [Lachnospiraceae bacterium 56-18]|jgi:multiple sugar transport system permease protein|nr:sugar ABC transporter permease [Dorea sp.]MCI9228105.1 sugar ABC transporter permease [Dorea sp.]
MGGIYIKNKWLPYLLILPTILMICIFKIYPIIDSVIQGFSSADSNFTLDNYKLLFADKTFWNSLKVTLKFNIIIIPIQIVVSFIMALFVNVKIRGIEVFRTVFYLPFCISLTISTVIWQMMLNVNNGVINSMLGVLGLRPIGFLIDKKWALLSIVLISSWRGCAYWMMFILAGLKGIDSAVYESAKIDGSGFFNTMFRITIPLLKNTWLFVLVANTTANFLLFAPMQIATDGGPQGSTNVLMYEAYKSAFKYSNRPRQACLVTILLIIVMLICFVQNRFMTDKEAHR